MEPGRRVRLVMNEMNNCVLAKNPSFFSFFDGFQTYALVHFNLLVISVNFEL